jgi:hypothetical protein
MAERPYADEGEVIESLKGIREAIARVEVQTTKTNGRVSGLEDRTNKQEQFNAAVKAVGALLILQAGWVLSIVMGWVK